LGVRGVVIGTRAEWAPDIAESRPLPFCPAALPDLEWEHPREQGSCVFLSGPAMTEDEATAEDRRRWMQQGVATRPVREPSELTCVTELPAAVGGAAYVPPAGFDCEPLHQEDMQPGSASEDEECEDEALQSERRKRPRKR
jgi:hypothetical protein